MKAILFTPVFCLAIAATAATQSTTRPHIVLVMADDQGWGDIGYNGHPVVKTPNLDKAAARGLRFDRFYAAAPVCSPTRASVLTGRHPNRMGVFKWGYSIRPQEVTIAESLQKAGYTTGHFGKWHVGSVRRGSPDNPSSNGFDTWVSAPNFYDNDAVMSHQGQAVKHVGESSAIAVDAALSWIEQQIAGDKPIFAVVWFGSPHSPHRAAAEDRALYRNESKKLQNFYGELTGIDRAFGRLRDRLGELGIRDNTLLWYCSDNGALPRVGATGGFRGNKGKVYDGGLLVPAFIEWPARITKPRRSDRRCNTCDIYPTVLRAAGVKVSPTQPELDGIDLTEMIDGEETAQPRSMGFWDFLAKGQRAASVDLMAKLLLAQQDGGDLEAVRRSLDAARLPQPPFAADSFPGHAAWIDGDWKLHRIERKNGAVRWEYYDLAADPYEEHDRYDEERCTSHREALETWLESVVASLNGDDYQKIQSTGKLRIFLLAGQSNMQGQAVVDLDHAKHYNGGRGTLVKLLATDRLRDDLAHLRDADGKWTERSDVQVWYRPKKGTLKTGPLSIGFAGYDGKHHFGPELEFGHVVGDRLKDPVLLVKTAWGGKSLFRDFRPPSAGGTTGPYYTAMLAGLREAIDSIPTHWPEHAEREIEISGMVWFQGWNDMGDAKALEEYAQNLAHLIRDVRTALHMPALPIVIGETGNCNSNELRGAQASVARLVEFDGTVAFVPTTVFRRPAKDSPNVSHGHHWFGNAESYFHIGAAFGHAMCSLLRH